METIRFLMEQNDLSQKDLWDLLDGKSHTSEILSGKLKVSSRQAALTEAEVARDLHKALEKVQQGIEVVIEQDRRPGAVIKPSMPAKLYCIHDENCRLSLILCCGALSAAATTPDGCSQALLVVFNQTRQVSGST